MNLFGYTINKVSNLRQSSSIPQLIWSWFYGREWAKRYDDTSLLNAYRSWVYVCSTLNAACVASATLKLYVTKKSEGTKIYAPTKAVPLFRKEKLFKRFDMYPIVKSAVDIEEVTEHPLLILLKNVNPFANYRDLFETTDIHQELTGSAYWWLKRSGLGIPEEIWQLPPDKMTIVPDREKFIREYILTIGAEKRHYEVDEVIHFKFPNPNDPYYGASPLQAVADTYNINQNMNAYENALFSNNARPQGFFTTEQEIDDPAFERLKAEVLETYVGVVNSGKTGLLDRGVKFDPINWTPRELGFLQGRKWTKEEIYAAYGVPLGLFDKDANRANAEAAQYTYMKFGIEPRCQRMEEKLNEKLCPMYDEKLFVAFEDIVPEDKEYRLKEDVEYSKIGARLINEIRASRGEKPVEGGDIPYVSQGMVPLGTPPKIPTQSEIPVGLDIDRISEKIVERLLK